MRHLSNGIFLTLRKDNGTRPFFPQIGGKIICQIIMSNHLEVLSRYGLEPFSLNNSIQATIFEF